MLIRPGLLAAVLPVAPTITGITATLLTGTDIEVDWTGNDMPFGVTYRVDWEILTGGIGSGVTPYSATIPQVVTADSFTGGTGRFTVNAYDVGLTLIATNTYSGVIIT